MSGALKICSIDPELKAKAEKLRFKKDKTNTAIVAIIDPEKQVILEDFAFSEELAESYDNPTIEEVASLLPAHLPRYILYSYQLKYQDGRISYPLCFIFLSPSGSKPDLQMLYAGSKLHFANDLKVTKVLEVRDIEEITQEWLDNKIKSLY